MRDPLALLEQLRQRPASFDFYAALRLVECAYPELPRIGQAQRPADEALRLGQQPSLAFEPAMLAGLESRGEGRAPQLLMNFFGLLGANGPLPTHLTEYIRDRQRNMGDPTLARFCDLFHHRLISLFYRAWASAQPALSLDRPQADHFARYLGSLIGIGLPSLRARDAVPDVAKLHYAGRLGPQARNAAGLAAVLSDFFQVPVKVQEFVGHWMSLPADGLGGLRSGPDAPVLGVTTVLGKKVWNTQHKFRLVMGPLDLEQTRRLLPGGESMRRLTDWVRQYAGLGLDWDVNLIVKKEQLPGLRLGRDAPLGWTSWLSSKAPERDDRQLVVSPRRAPRPESTSHEGPVHG
ncbi:type VI secretion system baseplate subunit TssG [Pseudomonas gingeri]|nr:type VI secretion system baseplate subunit TssG [Pseudomonas gingeri]